MTFHENDNQISPWHDIPLKTGQKEGIYNFICEIPKYTKPKMEINTKENFNPIEQDIKDEKPREYHGPIYWNYGCLPQTWENPTKIDKKLNHKGDNDPLDVVEIGDEPMKIGQIAPVKVLGILAMIDKGEVDWKVIAIRIGATVTNGEGEIKLAEKINDIGDVPTEVLSGIREWFRWYKTPDDGNPLNKFGLYEKFQNKEYAIKIIIETNEEYKNIVTLKHNIKSEKAQDLNLTSVKYGDLGGGMRKRRTSRRTKRKRKSLKKTRRTKRKRNTSKKSRRTRTRTRRR
jgi:inorganic pyrophosphatase